jgi:acyl-CoA dehydrogenase
MIWILLLSLPPLASALAYRRAPLIAWLVAGLAWLVAAGWAGSWGFGWTLLAMLVFGGAMWVFLSAPLRRARVTAPIFAAFRAALPSMSQTERDALEAGTVWWEGELFAGNPDWKKLQAYPWPKLTPEEQSFLDNETDELCRLTQDWECTQHGDMPAAVWQYIKAKGFLGMIIPREFGGKGFSAFAHSQVVTKLATRSSAPAVTVMVPNSLGPAELLLHYGTPEQKQHYLPRLARGEEIPAFALTSPWAGSDAASIPDAGVVCKGEWNGEQVLGLRVNFNKRYITLAPVCTVFGLAFHLYDPDRLLGGDEVLGITCALIPHDHPGVDIGRRHLPLNAVWMNGPVRGKDVFLPLDFIIGGPKMAGQGWRMLMECLAAGRSISLPGSNTGMQKVVARAVGAYARVRYQFKTAIGRFEGVEEALTRIGANTYLSDAARVMTAGAIDLGEKPSVVSAIVKYHVTERARQTVNDGMDVIGGKGICLGPQNFLGRAYQQIPVGITVEGANILTRSLILFGQGAIRCHPYVLKEMHAAQQDDLNAFDKALWGHVGFTVSNAARALIMGLTGSHFVKVPEDVAPETRRYYQQLTRFSAAFAFIADISMGTMGGALKRKEKLSARLGDILSLMYLATATLKRFEAEGRHSADAPLMHWAIWDCMFRIQQAFEGVIANFPNKFVAVALRSVIVFPLGRPYVVPSDKLGHQVAALLLEPSPTRDRLTSAVHLPTDVEEPVGALEAALVATIAAEPVEAKLKDARRQGRFDPKVFASGDVDEIWRLARDAGVISTQDYALVERRNAMRDKVIRVDDFPYDLGLKAAVKDMPDVSPAHEASA